MCRSILAPRLCVVAAAGGGSDHENMDGTVDICRYYVDLCI